MDSTEFSKVLTNQQTRQTTGLLTSTQAFHSNKPIRESLISSAGLNPAESKMDQTHRRYRVYPRDHLAIAAVDASPPLPPLWIYP